MNLCLYIPPLSAYPTTCFHGLIIGKILRYWNQNSNKDDFINIKSLFIQRLILWGHQIPEITSALQAAVTLINNDRSNDPTDNDKNTLFFHWKHNPNDINRSTIQTINNNTLNGVDNFTKMRIAVSRPRNLRDLLCHTRLPYMQDCNVSDILTNTPTFATIPHNPHYAIQPYPEFPTGITLFLGIETGDSYTII